MGLAKSIRRDPEVAAELARCVAEGQPYRLLDLKLYLTRRCNLRCLMCNAWTRGGDGRDELSTGEILGLIDEARALGLIHLKLFGGEPLLRRDLPAIVAHAAGLGIRCTLITNGTLLNRQRAQALVAAGLAQLDLSLDAGDPALHDQIRGVPGTWQRAVQGLQAVQAAARGLDRRVVLRVNTVVMRHNYHDLPHLARVLSDLGVDEIVLNPAIPQPANTRATAAQTLLSPLDIARYNAEIAPRVAAAANGHRLAANRELLYLYGATERHVEDAALGQYAHRLQVGCCFKPWYYAVIREKGDLVGCNTVKHPLARIGNVRETPLGRLWHSEAYRAFRARCHPPQFDDCRRCCYHLALLRNEI
ncbi:MAG: radical SAM protein [Anaerolineae bacterium]|nr:radical SAM protein [Anaerolineae bacterium]